MVRSRPDRAAHVCPGSSIRPRPAQHTVGAQSLPWVYPACVVLSHVRWGQRGDTAGLQRGVSHRSLCEPTAVPTSQGSGDSFALSLKQNLMLNLHSTPAPLCQAGAVSKPWMDMC